MIAIRWRIPAAPLRTSVIVANAVGLLVAVALALVARAWLDLGPWYPHKAAALFAAIMATAFGFVGEHHPFPRFGSANCVTMIRAILLSLVASLTAESTLPGTAATTAFAAIVTTVLDGVDGWLARRSRIASPFGARFDMEVDALLVMALSVLVWQYGKAGGWVLLCGLTRYLFVGAGWMLSWMRRPLRPTRRGRLICVLQMIGLSVAIVPGVAPPASAIVAAVTLAALGWSFAIDVTWLWRNRAALPATY